MPSWNGLTDLFWNILPGNYDRSTLAPLYSKIFQDYQVHDSEKIMFFEPGQFPDELGVKIGSWYLNMVHKLGFDTPPGGKIGSEKHVLNDHTYCC